MKKQSSSSSRKPKTKKKSPASGASPAPPSARSSPELSAKQRQYVRGRLQGKTKTAAALEAGYSASTANKAKEKIDSSPAVKKLFTEMLEAAGITDSKLAQRLSEALDAIETKFWSSEGEVSDERDVVAHGIRLQALELLLKLKGHLIDKHELRMVRTLEEILEASNDE